MHLLRTARFLSQVRPHLSLKSGKSCILVISIRMPCRHLKPCKSVTKVPIFHQDNRSSIFSGCPNQKSLVFILNDSLQSSISNLSPNPISCNFQIYSGSISSPPLPQHHHVCLSQGSHCQLHGCPTLLLILMLPTHLHHRACIRATKVKL